MNESSVPRAVFDCMVFLQGAARETSPAKACLNLVEKGVVELCLSQAIISEIKDGLTRPRMHKKFPSLTLAMVEEFLHCIIAQSVLHLNVPEEYKFARDPKDEPYINLALNARADYLVTRDITLLDLMNELTDEGRAFRFQHPFLTILDPVAFLRRIVEHQPKNIR
ncbi:MAG: putative toxin-antitoxin system toxin component, PIN family [Blastocatellia bacterium]